MQTMTSAQLGAEIAKGAFVPNQYLTNLSMAYFQAASSYVARSIFPIVPVGLSSAYYYTFSKEDLLRDNVARKPQFGKVAPAQMGQASGQYACLVDQIIVGIDQLDALNYQRSNAPGVADPKRAKVKFAAEQMLLHQDILFAKNFFKDSVWSDVQTGQASSPSTNEFLQFDQSGSNPIEIIDALKLEIKKRTGRTPNRLALGEDAFKALKNNSYVLERIKYGGTSANPATVTESVLAELFSVSKVVVLGSIYNSAALGASANMNFIFNSKDALLCYAADTPAIDEPSAGYIFAWDMLGDGQYVPTIQYQGENGTHSEFIESLIATDMKKTGDDLAVYLKSCCA